MRIPIRNDNYGLINLIFAAIILAVIGYSFIFGGAGSHPIPSASELFNAEESISTGLSRSFSAIVNLDFDAARQFNPFGIRIFLFMLIQLMMRIAGFLLSRHHYRQKIIYIDITVTAILFVLFFFPFLANLLREFSEFYNQ